MTMKEYLSINNLIATGFNGEQQGLINDYIKQNGVEEITQELVSELADLLRVDIGLMIGPGNHPVIINMGF